MKAKNAVCALLSALLLVETFPGYAALVNTGVRVSDPVQAPLGATGIPAAPSSALANLPVSQSLRPIENAQQELIQNLPHARPEQARPQAGLLFEGKGGAQVPPGVPEAGTPPPAGKSGLSPAGQAAKAGPSTPVPPRGAKRPRRLRLWHKIAISAMITLTSLGVAWHFVVPRLTPVKPPHTIVEVQKGPFDLRRDAAARVIRGADPKNQAPRLTLLTPGARTRSAAFSENGKTAVTISEDGSWRLWDLARGEASSPARYPGLADAAAFADGGRTLVILDKDSTVRVMDLQNEQVRTISLRAGAVARRSFSPDGKRLAIATKEGRVVIADLETAQTRAFELQGEVLALGSTSKGALLLTSLGGKMRIWSIAPGQEPAVIGEKVMVGGSIAATGLSEDGSKVLAAGVFLGNPGVVYIVQGSSKVRLLSAGDLELGSSSVASVALDRAGARAAVAAADGRVWVWSPVEDELRLLGKAPAGGSASFSADGLSVYVTDPTGAVRVWSALEK